MLSKKAQELPLRTLILLIIAIVVFIVIIIIFSKYSTEIFSRISQLIKGILTLAPEK